MAKQTESKESKKSKEVTLRYKLKLVVEVSGEIEGQKPLMDDTEIYALYRWAEDDIAEKLDGVCEVLEVKAVQMEEVERTL